MGASRREAGRRANESRRLVRLMRAFYLGVKEISNAEYRRFKPEHRSGSAEGVSLDGDSQPVVNVSWDDAARYCNWLSARERLPAAYREAGGSMVAVQPLTTGYRLPTEAEWAYVARVQARETQARYPWEGEFPPTSVAGNYADARIADTLAGVVPGYDDGYRATAPVGSFAARPPGFHDLGGNVAEWTHDFYAVYPGMAEQPVTDPAGPASGEHHVVRGSSWRQGSITELRLSYRDYSRTPRDDLGFRIARYAH
jgi:formylglycine-generating enzyme required for sulfatase activity